MPVPSAITDLSTTAASNSPAGNEAPVEGDNHLRTAYAFIRQLYDGVAGDAVSTLRSDLASSATATLGGGLVGYDASRAYVTATVAGQLVRFADTASAANGDALIGSKRTDTGAVATTVHALRERQLLDPIEFGAVPDYAGTPGSGTDNSSAFRLMAAAINTAGGGGIDLGRGRYRVFSDGSTADLFAFLNCRGVTIKSDGAEIVVDRTFTGSEVVRVFEFTACNNITFAGGIKGTCTQSQPANEHTSRGPQWCELLQGCSGFKADVTELTDFREGPHPIRAYNDPQSYACRNLDFGLIKAYRTGYPLAASLSGYNMKGTLHTEECGRSLFLTGVEDFDFTIRSKNHEASVDVLLATDRCNDSGSSLGAGVRAGKVKYINNESTFADNSINFIDLQVQQSDLYVGTHRDIDIEMEIENPAASNYGGFGFSISKIKDDGTADATDRGHVWENITVGGTIKAGSTNQRSISLSRLGTFGTGENFRNFKFMGLRLDGTGQPNFILTALKDVCMFSNYYYNGTTAITGATAAATLILNSYSTAWSTTGVVQHAQGNYTISPPQITSTQTDYDPTSAAFASVVVITSDAARTIHGFRPPLYDGAMVTFFNDGNFTITMTENATATAAWRFIHKAAANFSLVTNAGITYMYSGTRWKQIANS